MCAVKYACGLFNFVCVCCVCVCVCVHVSVIRKSGARVAEMVVHEAADEGGGPRHGETGRVQRYRDASQHHRLRIGQ